MNRALWQLLAITALVMVIVVQQQSSSEQEWTPRQLQLLGSLSLSALPPLPPDPSNAYGDNANAAALGHQLFFDPRLSASGAVACASCHKPELRFTDGLPTARAIGASARNTLSLVGVAHSPWFYWDGRKDSHWSQALSPLEDPAEQGSNRMRLTRLVIEDSRYGPLYSSVFGALPDFSDSARFPGDAAPGADPAWRAAWDAMAEEDQALVNRTFANLGKALAAYQRKLLPGPSRFDAWVDLLLSGQEPEPTVSGMLTADEAAGARLFIGKARCAECHNGPLFTNNEFHNIGLLPPRGEVPDQGRSRALAQVRADPFNCVGEFSDAGPGQCAELTFMRDQVPELVGAHRTPSLRNLALTAPYMHKGQMATLADVLAHYNAAPLALIGHSEAEPLGLSGAELRQLEAFLLTLDAPPATPATWLAPP